jgi:C4-dicarboxylate-binding protein DctP
MVDEVTRIDYRYDFYIVSANKQWWDGLKPDIRSSLQDALKAATAWNWENTTKKNEEAYAKVTKLGKKVNSLTPEQQAKWVEAVAPVWKEFGDKLVGPEVMAELKKISKANQ